MSLMPVEAVRGVDPQDGEPFYWRGWYDHMRAAEDGWITLRNSTGPQVDFQGRIRGAVCGRVRPPFKTFPRYYDLFLFETTHGELICQRRWVSEAHEEEPCIYDIVRAQDSAALEDALLNFDSAQHATNLWPEDAPGGMRRAAKVRKWIEESYAGRVKAICDEWFL